MQLLKVVLVSDQRFSRLSKQQQRSCHEYCILSLFLGRPGPCLAGICEGVKGLLLRGGIEWRTNKGLALTTKARIDNWVDCVAFVTNLSILDSRPETLTLN